ncbi:hypothetical protein AZI87_00720 [Bdellovibrio bacteriovorus]|uniref:Protein glutaminase domain-containing protein n=1 Tax=Bdellovibrio bacteriovorus TaxID=959 RepID=A0A162GCX6_BDEBC|nr:protein-glutamine glutaminase family protein [Bdellovibrio bacteriovorus]KYG67837.1 hypothetical protein AZI87_00720 [Bdellovibrio bacteriovorus]
MKVILALLVFFQFSLAFAQDDLHSFVKGLDTTLKHVNRSESRPCASSALTPSSAQATKYQGKDVTALSEVEAQTLFKEMQSHTEIPFDFAIAGCEERAHEMSRLMLLKGIRPLKMFASVDENKSPRLEIPHPNGKDKRRWKFHVAPLVMVRINGKDVPYIIDPSMEKKAVPLQEWKRRMTLHDPKMPVMMDATIAEQYDISGRYVRPFSDENWNRANQEKLKEFKEYSKDPDGENNYLFQMQRDLERMDMMD